MIIKIPQFTAIRYMVHDWGGPLRGFETKADAKRFAGDDDSKWIEYIPRSYYEIDVEEAPF